jgi:hypothetical protein
MVRFTRIVSFALVLGACGVATDEQTNEGEQTGEINGSPESIAIGFNGGPDQFDYWPDFFDVETAKTNARLCHTYLAWNVADEPDGPPDPQARSGTRAWFEAWLDQAKDECKEALISFQAHAPGAPPTEAEFAGALERFLATPWTNLDLAIAPWNEPNNGDVAGDGLGQPIEPELAARYYLSTARLCAANGCKAVAGDFASNGNFWNDFEWNCAPENVDPNRPSDCTNPSPLARGRGPSYLDRYKAVIVGHANEYGLGDGFRPAAFAYHGWHDVNEYLHKNDHCNTYDDCATRRVLKNLGGTWGGVEIWDTEVGIGQSDAPDDNAQGCGAAFLLRLHALSARIQRIYITRLHNGGGQLLNDHTPRPAMLVLAKRETVYDAGNCQ